MENLLSLLLMAGLFYFMMRYGCGAHMIGYRDHSRHPQSGEEATPGTATYSDPVCGITVASDRGYRKMHDGRQYRFCSRTCLDKFEANPEQYISRAA
jgi:YHS domain-containing protein